MRRTLTLFLLATLFAVMAAACTQPSTAPTTAPSPGATGSPVIPTLEPGGGTPNPSLEVPPPIY